jgi:arabinosaccharide transport system substrate-binding protein
LFRSVRDFPFGLAALSLLALSLVTGAYIATRPSQKSRATLTMWTFAKEHYNAYKEAIPKFEREHPGVTVDLQLVSYNATTQRLRSAFWADLDVPDLVEVEISAAGSFFRGSQENIGFLDLTDRIKAENLDQRMVAARFAPYTSRGRIFGLPHDVHPVQIAYRRDLLEKEGVDVSQIETWDDFVAVGQKLTRRQGQNARYLIELSDTSRDNLEVFLFQRGGGYFDEQGRCIMDSEESVQAMLQYVPLVAGPKRIGNNLGGGQILTRAVEDGYLLCLLAPDWRTKIFQSDISKMEGKMALMPLPAIEPGGRRTSTWGGTMIGVTKKKPKPRTGLETRQASLFERKGFGRTVRRHQHHPARARRVETACLQPAQPVLQQPAAGPHLRRSCRPGASAIRQSVRADRQGQTGAGAGRLRAAL